jgi:putative thioredoxin
VVAVIGGQIVDGFMGAMPESQVREWLGQIMQAAEQLGLPARPAGPESAAVSGASEPGAGHAAGPSAPGIQPRGPAAPGRPGPDDFLADSGFTEAQDAMERGDLDGAVAAFEKVLATSPGHPVATMGLAQVELIRRVNSYDQAKVRQDAQESADDAEAQARAADIDLAMGRIDAGFDRLLQTVRRTSGDERNKARIHLLSLFEAFPPRDPRVTKARATLSSLLF